MIMRHPFTGTITDVAFVVALTSQQCNTKDCRREIIECLYSVFQYSKCAI